jgi:hypothetical protein
MRDIYDVNKLDLQKIAISFGLNAPPRVNLNVKVSGGTVRKNKLKEQLGKRAKPFFNRESKSGERGGDKRQVQYS